MTGGIRREESRELFRRWCATAPDSAMRRWAETLLDPPGDRETGRAGDRPHRGPTARARR